MEPDKISWGRFVTRSTVRPKVPLTLNYDPEIAAEMEHYTFAPFQTRSVVSDKITVAVQVVEQEVTNHVQVDFATHAIVNTNQPQVDATTPVLDRK